MATVYPYFCNCLRPKSPKYEGPNLVYTSSHNLHYAVYGIYCHVHNNVTYTNEVCARSLMINKFTIYVAS